MSGGAARARVRSLALLATVATGITTTIAQPFFPQDAQDRFGASATAVGLVAAGCPAAQVVSTPVWTLLMGAVGRRWTLLLGCLVSTAGTVTFALAPLGVRGLLLGRVLMGVGSQGANASSIALIMEVSESLQADMGSLEFVWGLGYMVRACPHPRAFPPMLPGVLHCLLTPIPDRHASLRAHPRSRGGLRARTHTPTSSARRLAARASSFPLSPSHRCPRRCSRLWSPCCH